MGYRKITLYGGSEYVPLPRAYVYHCRDMAATGCNYNAAQLAEVCDQEQISEMMYMANQSVRYADHVVLNGRNMAGKPVCSIAWMVAENIKDTHRDCNYYQTADKLEAVY